MAKQKSEILVRGTKKAELRLPSVLSFRRSIEITDGLMRAQRSDDNAGAAGIVLSDHGRRTTKSHETTKESGDTQRSGEDSGNLVNGQCAKLPLGFDVLTVETSIKFMQIEAEADACNSDVWHLALKKSIDKAKNSDVMRTLSRLYAYNIANASWLWRNRTYADSIRVEIRFAGQAFIVVDDALDLSLRPVAPSGSEHEDPHLDCTLIDGLAKAIEGALSGATRSLRVDVKAYAQMMPGQAVWPSQRYMPNKRVVGKTGTGKEIVSARDYYTVGDIPAITSEKIGNALRTFDRDHAHGVFSDAVIPVEPNGGSLKYGINLRRSGNDLRSLLPSFAGVRAATDGAEESSLQDKDVLYVMACLVRGGLFGGASKDDTVDVKETLEVQA